MWGTVTEFLVLSGMSCYQVAVTHSHRKDDDDGCF